MTNEQFSFIKYAELELLYTVEGADQGTSGEGGDGVEKIKN
jgi:hypothetical protein